MSTHHPLHFELPAKMAARQHSITTIASDIVPGTVHLVDIEGHETHGRHLEGGDSRFVLFPQPSKDPEDPLNWTRRRKFWSLFMVYVYTLGVGIPTTLHYSVIADITRDTGISTTDLVQGNGVMFLFLGWACLFWQPIAMAYGRRGVYLISCLLLVPTMVWTAYSRSAAEWYGHRVFIGIVCSPIESLPEISIPDLFFAHERGTWMSTYVMLLFGSNFLSPIMAGWMDDGIGWRWTMHAGAIIAAVAFIILFFGMEETMYFRHTVEGIEVETPSEAAPELITEGVEKPSQKSSAKSGAESPAVSEKGTAQPTFTPLRTNKQKLMWFVLWDGRPSVKQVLTMMWRPLLIIIRFPNIAWAGFIYGINLSWYNVLNGTASPVLSAPPYNWRAALVGTIYVGPLIGAGLGCLWSGIVADKLALYLARRNNGTREPEHRLWPLAIAGFFSAVGLITWGVGADHHVHWIGLIFGLLMMTFGVVVGGSIGLSYAVDCFKEITGESMASIIIIRNTIGFGFSYAITPWYTNMGLTNCFITAGFVALACMATFLIMIKYGKAMRRGSARLYWEYAETTVGAH
ncbi:putative MFS-type transporter [Pseudocercospora fuligena]|uniref:Putative MFS-type transporter n=1 Tax=Pseudocercospora fuligena TaxID=685502 RepID=A0A8H6VQG3_9PEZI|nr:putative MFS-type transporter [Pseudocercospora fuligena]